MNLSKQIIVRREIIALFSEGYNSVRKITFGELSTYILKHCTNGNVIKIQESYKKICLYKNEKEIKSIPL